MCFLQMWTIPQAANFDNKIYPYWHSRHWTTTHSPIQHAARHVLPMSWITLHHLIGWFKARVGDISDCQLFVISLLSTDNRRICCQGEVNAGVGHQVGLELGEVHVQGTVETQRGCDWRYDLAWKNNDKNTGFMNSKSGRASKWQETSVS